MHFIEYLLDDGFIVHLAGKDSSLFEIFISNVVSNGIDSDKLFIILNW